MKAKGDEKTERYLTLLKLDAQNVFQKISSRKKEYLEIFAMRRTRDHFPSIFQNRYDQTAIHELALCSADLILALNQFYQVVDDMRWYLFSTEDMPNTVEDYIDRKIIRLEKLLSTLCLYLDAELGVAQEQEPVAEEEIGIFPSDSDNDISEST